MSAGISILAADALIALLTAAPSAGSSSVFSQPFTAVRRYAPIYNVEDLSPTIPTVTVVPRSRDSNFASRAVRSSAYEIDVAFQERLAKPDTVDLDQADAMTALVEEVESYLIADNASGGTSRRTLTIGSGSSSFPVQLTQINVDPLYDPTHVLEKQVFTSILRLRYEVERRYR